MTETRKFWITLVNHLNIALNSMKKCRKRCVLLYYATMSKNKIMVYVP